MDVSIIITNFNYARYLPVCIESCLSQATGLTFEVILVDDGSTDNSLALAKGYDDGRLRVLAGENGGIESASNRGVQAARGQVFVRVDADDYLLPGYLQDVAGGFINSTADFAYSDYQVVGDGGEPLSTMRLPPFDDREILSRGDFLATGTLYRRDAFLDRGGYNLATPNCGLENYEYIVSILREGARGMHFRRVRFAYRRHGLNISDTRREAIVRYGEALFERVDMGHYRTNPYHPYGLVLEVRS